MTRGSITGQVKALSMIVAMQNFIPDRRAISSEKKSAPATNTQPQIYAAAWRAPQQATTIDPQPRPAPAQQEDSPAPAPPEPCREPSPLPARRQRRLRTLAPASPPSPTALPPRKHRQALCPPVRFCSRPESAFLFKKEPLLSTPAELPILKSDPKISNFTNGRQPSRHRSPVLTNA